MREVEHAHNVPAMHGEHRIWSEEHLRWTWDCETWEIDYQGDKSSG